MVIISIKAIISIIAYFVIFRDQIYKNINYSLRMSS